jgi:hypothetical protein
MGSFVCDICHKVYDENDPKYIVKIEVFHAADTLSIEEEELFKTDFSEKIRELMEEMKNCDPEELMNDIYRRFSYTICRTCQRFYISDPMVAQREPI